MTKQHYCVRLQVRPLGFSYGDGTDISPMSGTVEFKEGVTSAMIILSVIDDEVSSSVYLR